MMKILINGGPELNKREQQYNEYLMNHIGNVQNVWYELLRPHLKDTIDMTTLGRIDDLIDTHDESKYDEAEWEGYLDYFYEDEDNPKPKDVIDTNFQYAWLDHLHKNPHHWNYWVLLEDEGSGKPEPLDMPIEHVLCMLCDWASFRYGSKDNPGKDGEFKSTREWYNAQRDNQIMTDSTRELIEKYIDLLP